MNFPLIIQLVVELSPSWQSLPNCTEISLMFDYYHPPTPPGKVEMQLEIDRRWPVGSWQLVESLPGDFWWLLVAKDRGDLPKPGKYILDWKFMQVVLW